MSLRHFFRPTAWTIAISVLLTALATVIIYMTILSALDGGVAVVPLWAMYIVMVIVLPLIGFFRLLGSIDMPLATVLGIAASFVWCFAFVCAGRWMLRFRKWK